MTHRDNRPFGVFDSGVGGLTVVQELRRLMPNESIIYVGDTARAPYGGKSKEELLAYGREIIGFLVEKGAKAVVMACGTSSSNSFDTLRKEFPDIPIIDTIRPAAAAMVDLLEEKPETRTVFIATAATVQSGLFARLVQEKKPDVELFSRACPLFAPMVEAGLTMTENHPLLNFVAETYLSDLRGKVNTLVLGCTHYPLLQNALTHALGEIAFINPATPVADVAMEYTCENASNPTIEYYTSGDTETFCKMARFILGEDINASKF